MIPNITTEFWRAILDTPLQGGTRGALLVLPEGVREQLLAAVLAKVRSKPGACWRMLTYAVSLAYADV